MKTLKFKKEESGNWYIVLPEWKGTKAELKMVSGADTLLDTLSDGKKKVEVLVSLTKEKKFNKLTKFLNTHIAGGAFYYAGYKQIWLCGVTQFVFDGHLPRRIYYKVATI
jgi:hypothetical protein